MIGFIGCGNMAQAMIGGMIKSGSVSPQELIVSNRSNEKLEVIAQYGVKTTMDNQAVAMKAEILIIAAKPHQYREIIVEIKPYMLPDTIVVSIAAGLTIDTLEGYFGESVKLIRTMPNTPAFVMEGMTAIMPNRRVTPEEIGQISTLFSTFGETEIIDESLIDAFIAVAGSSPAYVYMMIEAMADGAVRAGMPRDKAYRFAAQAIKGSSSMVLETSNHPGVLKDAVCSPGGTTIEAVSTLESTGFRGSILKTMENCVEKSRKMAKK